MLVCSCCLDSGHILDKICISEKIKVPSHTGFRRSVAVWDAQALELNSGPGLLMSTRSLLVNGSAGRTQVTAPESNPVGLFPVFSLSTEPSVT